MRRRSSVEGGREIGCGGQTGGAGGASVLNFRICLSNFRVKGRGDNGRLRPAAAVASRAAVAVGRTRYFAGDGSAERKQKRRGIHPSLPSWINFSHVILIPLDALLLQVAGFKLVPWPTVEAETEVASGSIAPYQPRSQSCHQPRSAVVGHERAREKGC